MSSTDQLPSEQDISWAERKTRDIIESISKIVLGQDLLKRRLVQGLMSGGHVLLEGVPGLAKTLAIKSLSESVDGYFSRIQFTPDLLPSDIVGTEIFQPQKADFVVRKGPVFANFVLADEINRAPAKVQSALLETMQERQVTIGDTTYKLPNPFFVLATQNPIEQEGTYQLPEAQVDRFIMKITLDYPSLSEESEMLSLQSRLDGLAKSPISPVATLDDILALQNITRSIYVDQKICDYISLLSWSTRDPKKFGLSIQPGFIQLGASPRASISMYKLAQTEAILHGDSCVLPQHVQAVALHALRHRITLGYEAELSGVTADDVVEEVIKKVKIP